MSGHRRARALALAALMVCSVVVAGVAFAGSAAGAKSVSSTSDLRTALSNAQDGEVITVASGTYSISSALTVDTKNVVLRGIGDPVIDDNTGHGTAAISVAADGVSVEGLTIRSADDWAEIDINANSVTVRNNSVSRDQTYASASINTYEYGSANDYTDIRIVGNEVKNGAIGVGADGSVSVNVSNNDVSGALAEGIWFYPTASGATITVKNNDISDYDTDDSGDAAVKIAGGTPSSVNGQQSNFDTAVLDANSNVDTVNIDGTILNRDIENVDTGAYSPTIQAAIDAASADDTITLNSGTYSEQVSIDKDVTLMAADGATPTVKYAPSSASGKPTVGIHAAGATVDGLRVVRVAASDRVHEDSHAQGIRIDASDVTVSDNVVVGNRELKHTRFDGIMAIDDDARTDITTVDITGNDVSGFYGGVVATTFYSGTLSDVTVSDNTVSDSHTGVVVKTHQSSDSPTDVSVNGNTLHADVLQLYVSDSGDSYQGYTGLGAVPHDQVTVLDNTYDTNATVSGAPDVYATIQSAVDAASAGDTIEVAPGTYAGSTTGHRALSITTDGLTLVSTGTAKNTVIAGNDQGSWTTVGVDASDVTLDGFTIRAGDNAYRSSFGVRVVDDSDGFTLRNSIVEDVSASARATGVTIYSPEVDYPGTSIEDVELVNNTIRDIHATTTDPSTKKYSDSKAKGISLNGDIQDALVKNNSISNIGNDETSKPRGLTIVEGNVGPTNFVVLNNTITGVTGTVEAPALFVGGYESLGADHAVARNTFGGTVRRCCGVSNDPGYDTLRAPLNYWGSSDGPGASGAADTRGKVDTTPFLTAPADQVAGQSENVQQFGYNLTVPGDGQAYAVGFPGSSTRTVGEAFDDFEGTLWTYDASNGWIHPDEGDSVEALDAIVVVADTDAHVTVDFADSNSQPAPGERSLHAGWNFVAAPEGGNVETALGAASADPARVLDVFANPQGQPNAVPSEDSFTAYSFGSGSAPSVSPFTGYWVYANQNGTVAANVYDGATAGEIESLLGA